MVITRAVAVVASVDVTFVVGAEAFVTLFVPVVGDSELGVVTVGDAALLFAEDEVLAGAALVFEPSPTVAAASRIVGAFVTCAEPLVLATRSLAVFSVSLVLAVAAAVAALIGASEAVGVIGGLGFTRTAVAGRMAGVAAASSIAKCLALDYLVDVKILHKIGSLIWILRFEKHYKCKRGLAQIRKNTFEIMVLNGLSFVYGFA